MKYEAQDAEGFINEDFDGRALSASRWLLVYKIIAVCAFFGTIFPLALVGIAHALPLAASGILVTLFSLYAGYSMYSDANRLIKEDSEYCAVLDNENSNGDGI